jgi:hypothetical protein
MAYGHLREAARPVQGVSLLWEAVDPRTAVTAVRLSGEAVLRLQEAACLPLSAGAMPALPPLAKEEAKEEAAAAPPPLQVVAMSTAPPPRSSSEEEAPPQGLALPCPHYYSPGARAPLLRRRWGALLRVARVSSW